MSGSERGYHITVYENIFPPRERFPGARRSHRSRLSPLPQLTGDVGRGCGDASRALLFCLKFYFTDEFFGVPPISATALTERGRGVASPKIWS